MNIRSGFQVSSSGFREAQAMHPDHVTPKSTVIATQRQIKEVRNESIAGSGVPLLEAVAAN
jgi:hypothetical protein